MVGMHDFIDGRFVVPAHTDGSLIIRSPADQADLLAEVPWSVAHVEVAVASARRAFKVWRKVPKSERAALLKKYQVALKAHADELALMIAREIGKPLWEAKTEVASMIGKVDLSLGEGDRFVADVTLADLPGEIRHRPHGVVAVVGPFNFPGHLPNGQIVPALLTGNTVVFKPSDKGPGTAALMAKCFLEAGFPSGAFNVVQGGVAVAEALTTHADIDAILFTGSLSVGQRIAAANAHRPGLLVALELGGKNASLVFDDANVERAAREIAFSGFATAGQRCTATSRVVVTKGVADQLINRVAALAKGVNVGHHSDATTFMGPLISEQSRTALLKAQSLAVAGGFEAVAPGGAVEVEGRRGWYVRPAVHVAQGSSVGVKGYSDVELFAPDLAVFVVDDVDAVVAVANDTPFGLSAAVYTQSKELFEHAADELRVGVLHFNKSSAGASGRLPFGGIRGSGNHRPAGILMSQSCTWSQGVLLPAAAETPLPTWPGMRF